MADTLKMSDIRVGMRVKFYNAPDYQNHMLVTAITDRGFRYSIPDDQEVIDPHWSMPMCRDGHEWFGFRDDSLCVEAKPDNAAGGAG